MAYCCCRRIYGSMCSLLQHKLTIESWLMCLSMLYQVKTLREFLSYASGSFMEWIQIPLYRVITVDVDLDDSLAKPDLQSDKHSHTKHLKIDEVQLLCAYYYEFKIQDACDLSNSLEKWRYINFFN
ncbi:hypothetical protein Hanom_Chr06g00492621 [Helianthus anomalus]